MELFEQMKLVGRGLLKKKKRARGMMDQRHMGRATMGLQFTICRLNADPPWKWHVNRAHWADRGAPEMSAPRLFPCLSVTQTSVL